MRPPQKPINVNAMARKVDVDNRIPLRNYYRIADNLLKQASIYRGEKNIVDLYIILLRYSSLVSETIPFHRDYQVSYPKERSYYRKKLLVVIDELESLKPEFQNQVDKHNLLHARNQQYQLDGHNRTSYGSELSYLEWPLVNNRASLSFENNGHTECIVTEDAEVAEYFLGQVDRAMTAGRQLVRSLELQPLNDLGFPRRYVRCLQISEVVNSMKDLMDFCRDQKVGLIGIMNYRRRIWYGTS